VLFDFGLISNKTQIHFLRYFRNHFSPLPTIFTGLAKAKPHKFPISDIKNDSSAGLDNKPPKKGIRVFLEKKTQTEEVLGPP